LWIVAGLTAGLTGLSIYLPPLAQLFYFEPLPPAYLLSALGLGLASVLWFEVLKLRRSAGGRH
jgi:Ca2+-transporting ATPase